MRSARTGDLVMFESDVHREGHLGEYVSRGIVIAELPSDGILAHAVSVLWSDGSFSERTPPRILEVIQCLPLDKGGDK